MDSVRTPTDFDTFQALDIRAGTVVHAEPFPEARKPAIKLRLDFGPDVGELASSAQLTRRYEAADLLGRTLLAVVNFPPLRVAGFKSECLVLGVINPEDPGDIVLVAPDDAATAGWALG
ncbi:MAG: tRNA-binding protein [Longimicrobiales bacterium]